jgi:hypothetical protein
MIPGGCDRSHSGRFSDANTLIHVRSELPKRVAPTILSHHDDGALEIAWRLSASETEEHGTMGICSIVSTLATSGSGRTWCMFFFFSYRPAEPCMNIVAHSSKPIDGERAGRHTSGDHVRFAIFAMQGQSKPCTSFACMVMA